MIAEIAPHDHFKGPPLLTELPTGGPNYGHQAGDPYRRAKETHELIFLLLSWLTELLDDDDGVAHDGGHTPANKLTKPYSFRLQRPSFILDIHV